MDDLSSSELAEKEAIEWFSGKGEALINLWEETSGLVNSSFKSA